MPEKTIALPDNIYDYDFSKLSKNEPDPKVRVRLLGMAALQEGIPSTKVAKFLNVHYATVSNWVNRFAVEGVQGLRDKPRSGRKRKINTIEIESFKNDIKKMTENRNGGRLIGKDIQDLLRKKYSADYKLSGVYNLLNNIGLDFLQVKTS